MSWPPRSPACTPADIHVWDHVKATLYLKTVNTRGNIWRLIQAVGTKINELTLNFGVKGVSYTLQKFFINILSKFRLCYAGSFNGNK